MLETGWRDDTPPGVVTGYALVWSSELESTLSGNGPCDAPSSASPHQLAELAGQGQSQRVLALMFHLHAQQQQQADWRMRLQHHEHGRMKETVKDRAARGHWQAGHCG